jgi:hypothetical protein
MAIVRTGDLAILLADDGTTATLTDVTVDDVTPAVGRIFGRCVHAQTGASVVIERAELTRCREVAVTASSNASVTLRDATLSRILPIECETGDSCDAPSAGIGLVALPTGGRIDVERFEIAEAALTGVQVVPGGQLDMRDGVVRNSPVGVNIQADSYDLSRLTDRVVFLDNGTNFDGSSLPVPPATISE